MLPSLYRPRYRPHTDQINLFTITFIYSFFLRGTFSDSEQSTALPSLASYSTTKWTTSPSPKNRTILGSASLLATTWNLANVPSPPSAQSCSRIVMAEWSWSRARPGENGSPLRLRWYVRPNLRCGEGERWCLRRVPYTLDVSGRNPTGTDNHKHRRLHGTVFVL